jgi:hypothetical protein
MYLSWKLESNSFSKLYGCSLIVIQIETNKQTNKQTNKKKQNKTNKQRVITLNQTQFHSIVFLLQASFFHKIGGGVPNTILSLVSGYYWILLKQETPGIVKKEFIHAPPVTPNYLYLRRPHPKDPIPTSNLLVWKAHYLNRFFIQTHSLITQKNNRNE